MKIKFIIIILLITNNVGAQQLVFDPAVVSTLVLNHTAQQTALKDIKDSEAEIATAQKIIAVQMSYIREHDSYEEAVKAFVGDYRKSGLGLHEFVELVNSGSGSGRRQ